MTVFPSATRRNLTPYIPLVAYIVFACFIALAGFHGFRKIEGMIEVEKLHDLGLIADMKVGQIASWQEGHIKRAKAFSNGALLVAEFDQWLQEGKVSVQQEEKLLRVLTGLQHTHGYVTASLIDRQGVVRITTGKADTLDGVDVKLVQEAMNSRNLLFSDIHRSGHGSQDVSLSLAAPLIDPNIKNGQVVGAVLLQIDPHDFFYPLIQLWPSESPSAETLLTRQEGGEVVFINELRHRKGVALSLRVPLTTSSLPTVMATQGKSSTLNGVDYRGVAVVAAMRRVPGTAWFMISKVDRDEIFAPISQLKKWAASLGLAFAVLGGFFFFVWLQGVHARQRQFKAQHDAALERELLLKHFEYLTRYANDMIMVSNEAGMLVEANERVQQALGYSRDELLKKHIEELHSPLDSPTIPGKLELLKREGALITEGIYQRKDGSTFPVEISARVVEVHGARYLQGIIRDITERKVAEELIRSREAALAEFKYTLDQTLDCVFIFQHDTLRFTYANNGAVAQVGYSEAELLQMTPLGIKQAMSEVQFRDMVQPLLDGSQPSLTFATIHRHKDGHDIPVEVNLQLVRKAGQEPRFVAIVRDVSERKRAMEALRESESRFRNMADSVLALIWLSDTDNLATWFSKGWLEYTGRTLEQELGLGWADSVHPDDLSWCVSYCNEAFRARRSFKMEFRLRRADGSYGWIADTGIPRFTSDGEFEGYIGYCWDITEHKLFEEMRAKMEHAGRLNVAAEMASGLAHELSQPLSACNNYLDGCLRRMDENDWDREKLHKAVQLAHKQVERAGKIINHLKVLVRKQGHERTLIDINLLAREVMGFLEDEIKRQGVSINMILFPLPQVMACRVEIEQVLLNLYKNAIEAMHSYPQRELRVSTRTTESGDVLVVVSDTGRGILSSEMAGLFNPYQTSKKEGLGLGLAICRTSVENHGGRIWADPQRELGAEFYFTLPVGGVDS